MNLSLVIVVFFVASEISVVTGSTSLLTVPVMFLLGIAPRTAIATNMFALTFMSVGGVLPFLRGEAIDRKRMPWLIVLTLAGSICGAFLLLIVPQGSVPLIVSSAMIGVALFSLFYREAGVHQSTIGPTMASELVGYALTFLLGVYGGFFSGGYVTMLTAVYVVFLRMTFLEAVANTKLANIFSSGISTVIFMRHGLVDYRLGIILGITMFVGALIGSRFALRLGNEWLRRIYLIAVWLLGLKTLLYDVLAKQYVGHRTPQR